MNSPRRHRPLTLVAITAALAAVVIAGGAASASQIGDHLLPPLEEGTDPLESPLPHPPPKGNIGGGIGNGADDTLNGTLDELQDGSGGGDTEQPVNDPGTDDPVPGGGDDATGGGGDTGSNPGGTGDADGTGGSGDGSGNDGGTEGSSAGSTEALGRAAAATSAYGSAAAQATLATATRAIRLAGPLSAPLLFGVLAVVGLIALGRGSDGLLKIEHIRETTRSFRL